MGILFKIIVILGLFFLIAGMFTKSKSQRAHNRNRVANILLALIAALVALSIGLNFFDK